jgi:hypothetical protein
MKSFLVVVLVGCAWNGIEGSGTAKSEVRPVKGFKAIELSGAVSAEILISDEYRVEISGDDNLVPLVTTELEGETLEVDTRKNMRRKLPLVARINAPQIGAIKASGSHVVTLLRMRGDALDLQFGGSVKVRGGGTVGKLGLVVSGSADVELEQLAAESVTVDISGSAEVEVTASRSLAVEISGSATVSYRGDPASVTQDISGSGKLVKR